MPIEQAMGRCTEELPLPRRQDNSPWYVVSS